MPSSPLSKKIGEVRFRTKIQTENVFFGKTNSRGLLRQNWAKRSSGTILLPNAPCSQLGPEKRYGAGFVKKFRSKTCFLEWTKLRSRTLLPPVAPSIPFGQENRWGAILYKNSNRKLVFWKKLNWEGFWGKIGQSFRSEQFCPRTHRVANYAPKRYGAGFVKKFRPKTCFLGWTKLRSGTLLPPIAPSSPFGQANRWGVI